MKTYMTLKYRNQIDFFSAFIAQMTTNSTLINTHIRFMKYRNVLVQPKIGSLNWAANYFSSTSSSSWKQKKSNLKSTSGHRWFIIPLCWTHHAFMFLTVSTECIENKLCVIYNTDFESRVVGYITQLYYCVHNLWSLLKAPCYLIHFIRIFS